MTSRMTQTHEKGYVEAFTAFRAMLTIRRFEERCQELGAEGLVAGSIHLCVGQEAIPVGAVAALTEGDRILTTYRGHGWALARGVPLDALLGEVCQREGGVNGGRAGSPHLSAPEYGFLGENSIVGAGIPIATGVALASMAKKEDRVVLVSIGDGAMNQGATHEGFVFAAARDLPVIFICENNGWAEMTPFSAMVRGENLVDRAAAMALLARSLTEEIRQRYLMPWLKPLKTPARAGGRSCSNARPRDCPAITTVISSTIDQRKISRQLSSLTRSSDYAA